jgi:hypothetical protein
MYKDIYKGAVAKSYMNNGLLGAATVHNGGSCNACTPKRLITCRDVA